MYQYFWREGGAERGCGPLSSMSCGRLPGRSPWRLCTAWRVGRARKPAPVRPTSPGNELGEATQRHRNSTWPACTKESEGSVAALADKQTKGRENEGEAWRGPRPLGHGGPFVFAFVSSLSGPPFFLEGGCWLAPAARQPRPFFHMADRLQPRPLLPLRRRRPPRRPCVQSVSLCCGCSSGFPQSTFRIRPGRPRADSSAGRLPASQPASQPTGTPERDRGLAGAGRHGARGTATWGARMDAGTSDSICCCT